ncbi:coiled-coil domain-containing protein 91-like isoform X1 [Brienomyrus brachyistius]|uniref:coiled-coil domain-containing protein 91-like isoform X1 n=2 Tax=Brienomyrus brachyistius TaxID=42636 RepID=UPI0020B333EA|nr:coiled-coil domain-containing protein 91-like isoform X1 [Brienomyrus brachyistius]
MMHMSGSAILSSLPQDAWSRRLLHFRVGSLLLQVQIITLTGWEEDQHFENGNLHQCGELKVPVRMDDDDFGGFEAAETFDCEDTASQTPVSPAIPWAAFSSVPGLSAPPDILLDQHPSFQAESQEPAPPPCSPPDQCEQTCSSDDASAQDQGAESRDAPDIPGGLETHGQLQQALSNLKTKLMVSEEEKARIQQDLEELLSKQAEMEERFKSERRAEAESHERRYAELREKHDRALEDVRKAGHESLAIIVEEFKAQTKSAVLQQQEVSEKHLEVAVQKQQETCEGLLNAQHQRLLDLLDAERDALEEKVKETLSQQAQHQKELLEKCLQEEKQKAQDAVEEAVKAQEERMKEAVLEAVRDERRRADERWAEQRAEWEAEHLRDRETLARAIEEALTDQRRISKEAVKEAIAEERQAGERRLEDSVLKVRNDLTEFMKEQKNLERATRQRNLASLELFLSCAQKQLSSLMLDGTVEGEGSPDTSASSPSL